MQSVRTNIYSSAGGSKRPRLDTSAGADHDGAAPKRAKPEPGRSASPHAHKNDDTFWYHDGNVIIRVHGTVFKLHRSRLSRHCGYFKNLFESGVGVNEYMQRCPVYNAPEGLTPKGFKDLLMAIESPLENVESSPSQSHTVSLLAAAHLLSCDAVLRLAKKRLCELWDSRHVPTKRGPGDIRSYKTTISTIHLAREYNIPGVLKRAFYELLSSEEFWDVCGADEDAIDLPKDDIVRLYRARDKLGRLWREFTLAVPDTDTTTSMARRLSGDWCCYNYSERGHSWRSYIVEKGDLESGALDPLRYNVVSLRRPELRNEKWCEGCLGNKESAWNAKRAEWWGMLDDLFRL
ncbi:hypothetical protein LXA43DRAFT_73967 [Ganoderma leucocontextum]|nr:hypothetical protein LXA43DRAFT_73967 [Ganoderma leucocontextum]